MGTRDAYAPGAFSWTDLATTDPVAASAFYGALFGWEGEETPAGDSGAYWMMRRDGRDVAGMSVIDDEQHAAGASPAWLCYVTIEDADATAARVAELGGVVVVPPFDVLDAGRVALVQDPQGAMLALWQPRGHVGAGLVNEPGAMVLNQLNTDDPEAAVRFYSELFGWSVREVAGQPHPYWAIENAGSMNGGVMDLLPGGLARAHWLVYFATADLDDAAETIAREGGQVVVPAMAIQSGRILVARDPQGARFALLEGEVQQDRMVSGRVDPRSAGRPPEDAPTLRDSVRNLRVLAKDLAGAPDEIQKVQPRGESPSRPEVRRSRPGRLRRAGGAFGWLLMVIAASAALGLAVVLLSRALS